MIDDPPLEPAVNAIVSEPLVAVTDEIVEAPGRFCDE